MNKSLKQPIPQGKYIPAVRHNDLIYTSGMTPRKAGNLIFSGQIQVSEPLEKYKEALQLATQNALNAALLCLDKDEQVGKILQLNIYLNAETGFTAHAKIADFASEFLICELGKDCIGTRAAVGVASLPSNAPVEITLTASILKTI